MIKTILHFVKSFSKIRFSYKIGRQLLLKAPYYQVKPGLKRVLLSTNRYGSQCISLVQRMGKLFFTPVTHARPNSLIRAFNSVSTLVRFRYETPLNDISFSDIYSPLRPYDKLRSNFVNNLRFASIKLGKYISKGAHGAVWAAQCPTDSSTVDHGAEGESNEIVVKVLYNYYASSTDRDEQPHLTSPDQWILLHEQRRREVDLRPPDRHPNIVPILRDFFDRVPSSGKGATLERVEDFPEGFGGEAHTYYLVMPRFDGSLENLVEGKWKPVGTLSPNIDSVSSPTRQEVKIKELEVVCRLSLSFHSYPRPRPCSKDDCRNFCSLESDFFPST
ncbi:unnamed protein product [Hymenolepis diminuta]|uniref:Protein kinase domain-containing protein n=1 Tax=Hymenolepis diminuta TaxID=6216 RepID=A0A564Y7S4_HYMDI|nr:unnamed protein product [Hymenolepis diminuta]